MTLKNKIALPVILVIFLTALISCAGGPDAKNQVRGESTIRAYERFLDDRKVIDDSELESAGIHYKGKFIYVNITLTDTGGDRYPEWGAEKLTIALYGYRAVDHSKVSDDEFFELVLKFALDEIVKGEYENLAKIRVAERDVRDFVEMHLEDF